jgi:hypothetical protein
MTRDEWQSCENAYTLMRAVGGTVSKEQKDWHEYLRGLGDCVVVAKGKEQAVDAVQKLMAVTR